MCASPEHNPQTQYPIPNHDQKAVSNKMLKQLSRYAPRGVSDDFLPTCEVYDEVKDTRVLFSFASASGGLQVAKQLRELVVSELTHI